MSSVTRSLGIFPVPRGDGTAAGWSLHPREPSRTATARSRSINASRGIHLHAPRSLARDLRHRDGERALVVAGFDLRSVDIARRRNCVGEPAAEPRASCAPLSCRTNGLIPFTAASLAFTSFVAVVSVRAATDAKKPPPGGASPRGRMRLWLSSLRLRRGVIWTTHVRRTPAARPPSGECTILPTCRRFANRHSAAGGAAWPP